MTSADGRKRRSHFLFLAAAAVLAGWVGFVFAVIRTSPAAYEQRAVHAIENRGGRVEWVCLPTPGARTAARMADVDFNRHPLGPADWEDLRQLRHIRSLNLVRTNVTDADLENLPGATRLGRLMLDGTGTTDEGLAHVAGMTCLTTLSLRGTRVSDAGLAHLQGLFLLDYLDLGETAVTDAGLADLERLGALRDLKLEKTRVTDARIEAFRTRRRDVRVNGAAQSFR